LAANRTANMPKLIAVTATVIAISLAANVALFW
jgi:hypothetical protein